MRCDYRTTNASIRSAREEEELWGCSGRNRGGSTCGRRSACGSQRLGGNPRRRVPFEDELPDDFPIQPDKDLYFIRSGKPIFSRRFPFGKAVAAGGAIPGNRIIVDEFALAIPERGPLCARNHLIIRKDGTDVGGGVLKNGGDFEIIEVFAVPRKLKRTKHRVRVWSDLAAEQCLDGRRYEWRGRNGGSIGNGRCIGDGRWNGDRRR